MNIFITVILLSENVDLKFIFECDEYEMSKWSDVKYPAYTK